MERSEKERGRRNKGKKNNSINNSAVLFTIWMKNSLCYRVGNILLNIQVVSAARHLNSQLRIQELVCDKSWKPGVHSQTQAAAKWRNTANKLQGGKAGSVLKLLQNNNKGGRGWGTLTGPNNKTNII